MTILMRYMPPDSVTCSSVRSPALSRGITANNSSNIRPYLTALREFPVENTKELNLINPGYSHCGFALTVAPIGLTH